MDIPLQCTLKVLLLCPVQYDLYYVGIIHDNNMSIIMMIMCIIHKLCSRKYIESSFTKYIMQ